MWEFIKEVAMPSSHRTQGCKIPSDPCHGNKEPLFCKEPKGAKSGPHLPALTTHNNYIDVVS